MRLKTDVRVLNVGATHTTMATNFGRLYCWGDNEELQLGTSQTEETMAVFRVMKGEEKLRQIAVGDSHTVILTKNKACFTYGKNTIGQLGLEDREIHERIELNEKLTQSKLMGVYAKGEESYGVTGDGKLLFWPVSNNDLSIGVLQIPNKQLAKSVALGDGFTIILTQKGHLYSYGTRNEKGQLGLGHTEAVRRPAFISSIAKERVVSVSSGKGHVLALTKNSKVFSWGEGSDGQLGLGLTDDFLNPTNIKLQLHAQRVIQVAASYRGSYALFDGGDIYWWGRNSRIRMVMKPCPFREARSDDFYPVQVRTSWSENFSLTYIIYCDMRYLDNMNSSSKKKIAKMIAVKWAEGNSQFEIPFSEGYSKHVTSKNTDFGTDDFTRKKPDIVETFREYKARPDIFVERTTDSIGRGTFQPYASPMKKSPTKSMKSPTSGTSATIKRSREVDPENWAEVLRSSNPHFPGSPQKHIRGTKDQASPFKSSARRKQYSSATMREDTFNEIKKRKKKENKTGLNPTGKYTYEELYTIKQKVKDLILKPRNQWNEDDREYFRVANSGDLKRKLAKVKVSK